MCKVRSVMGLKECRNGWWWPMGARKRGSKSGLQNMTRNGINLCVQLVAIASDLCTQDKHIRYTVTLTVASDPMQAVGSRYLGYRQVLNTTIL